MPKAKWSVCALAIATGLTSACQRSSEEPEAIVHSSAPSYPSHSTTGPRRGAVASARADADAEEAEIRSATRMRVEFSLREGRGREGHHRPHRDRTEESVSIERCAEPKLHVRLLVCAPRFLLVDRGAGLQGWIRDGRPPLGPLGIHRRRHQRDPRVSLHAVALIRGRRRAHAGRSPRRRSVYRRTRHAAKLRGWRSLPSSKACTPVSRSPGPPPTSSS
jgi:hypothetical protein